MQVIEVSMRDQHEINGRQIADPQPRPAQAFQDKKPAGEVRIDQDISSADLNKEGGVADEGESQLPMTCQHRLMSFACTGRDDRMAHQSGELAGSSSEGRM